LEGRGGLARGNRETGGENSSGKVNGRGGKKKAEKREKSRTNRGLGTLSVRRSSDKKTQPEEERDILRDGSTPYSGKKWEEKGNH